MSDEGFDHLAKVLARALRDSMILTPLMEYHRPYARPSAEIIDTINLGIFAHHTGGKDDNYYQRNFAWMKN